MTHRLLTICGILAALLYTAMNAFVPMRFEGYNLLSQTVSELSAIGAPTRSLWIWLGVLYGLLIAAFGWGIFRSADRGPLRVVGILLLVSAALSVYWPPMHLRGAQFTLTDALHIVWSVATVLLMLLAIGFGAAAFGRRFRLYSIATMVILVAFGALTALEAPRLAANLPTPWMGVYERISIAAFMLWIVALATALLSRRQATV